MVSASEYLLGAGVVMALLAALLGLTDFLGNLVVVPIEAFSWYRRTSSGAADSTGTALSLIAVLLVLGTGWLGWEMVYRYRVAIADDEIV